MTPHLPTHEIQVGAIIGIRVWYVKEGHLHSSVGQNRKWEPGLKQVARKERGHGAAGCFYCPGGSAPCTRDPSYDNSTLSELQCGLHATPDIGYFPGHIPPYCTSSGHMGSKVVFGLVRLFGRVVEGNYGWRAEFAEVHALCEDIPSPNFIRCDDTTLTTLAAIYDVPLVAMDELDHIVEEANRQ